MIIDFTKALALASAYVEHKENIDGRYHALEPESAAKLITAARDAAQFFLEENVRALLKPLDDLTAIILEAERDDEHGLAESLRCDMPKLTRLVGRRLFDALTASGREEPSLESALRASVEANEKRAFRAFPREVLEYDGKGPLVVPMPGKAGA